MAKKILLVLFILGLLVLGLNMDFQMTMEYIKSIRLSDALILGLMQIMTMILIAIQWNSIIRLVSGEGNFAKTFIMNSYGNVVDGITPGAKVGGEISRAYYIKNNFNITYESSAVIVGLQKTISIASFVLLYVLSILYFVMAIDSYIRNKILFIHGIIFLGIFLFVCILRKNEKILDILVKKFKCANNILKTLEDYKGYIVQIWGNKYDLLSQIILGFLIWILYPIKMYVIMRAFNMDLGFPLLISITYISYMAAMIPLLPGSVGSFESAMVYLLSFKNILMSKSFAISFIFRFFTFWFEMLVSLLFIGLEKFILFLRRKDIDKIKT